MLLNRSAVRRAALDEAVKQGRKGIITQVDATVYAACEAAVRATLRRLVESHPSAFRTLSNGH